jgi:thioredoxin 1
MNKKVRAAAITLSLMLFLAGVKVTGDVLVTFVELGSVNCVPCKLMQPILRDIESAYRGQVKVIFHDVWTEEGKPFAKQFGIRVIPTQVFLDASGVEYFRHEGFFPREKLVEVLKTKGVK